MRRSEWMRQWRTLEWILVVLLVIHTPRISLGATIPVQDASDELVAQHTVDYTIYTVRDRMPKIWRLLLQNTSVQDISATVAQQNLRETSQVVVFGGNSAILSRTYRSVSERRRRLERNQRSANLTYAMGSARKIQLFIKNHFLQLLPDGTVNGTQNVHSDYTILQRTTVDVGKIKIQGVATCLYLCMDMCGGIYASRKFNDDCVFNESMEEQHYNSYSSSYNSNSHRVMYLGINRFGQPRRTCISRSRTLGDLAAYTNSLTHLVDQKRANDLVSRVFGANHVRHGLKQLCDSDKAINALGGDLVARPKCNIGRKAGKKKRCDSKKCNVCPKMRPKKKKKKHQRGKEVGGGGGGHPTTTEADDAEDRTFISDDDP